MSQNNNILDQLSFSGDLEDGNWNTPVKTNTPTPTPKTDPVIETPKQTSEEGSGAVVKKKAEEEDIWGDNKNPKNEGDDGEGENTKQQQQQEEEVNIIEALNQDFGVEGEFEETAEGFKKFTSAAVEKKVGEEFDKLFSAMPDVKEYIESRQLGYTPEQIASRYSKTRKIEVELKDEATNIPQQKQVLRALYAKKGIREDKIEKLIQRAEDSSELYSDAVDAYKEYQELLQLEEAQEKADREAEIAANQEKINHYWNQVDQTIKEGDLGAGIKLSDPDKQAFFDYIARPIDSKGTTQEMLDREKMSIQNELALRFMLYKKFDLSAYITSRAKQLNFNRLKQTKKDSALPGGNKTNPGAIDLKNLQFKVE